MGVFDVLLKFVNAVCGGQKADPEPTPYQPAHQPATQPSSGYPGQQPHQQPHQQSPQQGYPPPQQQPHGAWGQGKPQPHTPPHHEPQYPQPQHEQRPQQGYPPPQQQPHGAWGQGKPQPHQPPHHEPQHPQPQHEPQRPQPQYSGSSGAPMHQAHHKSDRKRNENMDNQNTPWYVETRAKANAAGNAMGRCFDESKRAYEAGDGARAKELSNEGKAHKAEMESLNAQAAQWIFVENNTDSQPGEVDLHGLFVKEAIQYADKAVQEAKARGETTVRLIVGKGMHSRDGRGKLGPAIEQVMEKNQLQAEIDPHNSGVLIVHLGGSPQGGMRAGEIERRLENDREECVIM